MKNILLIGTIFIVFIFNGCTYRLKGNPSIWAAQFTDGFQKKLPYTTSFDMRNNLDKIDIIIYKVFREDNAVIFESTSNYFDTFREELKLYENKKQILKPICNNWQFRRMLDRGFIMIYKVVKKNNNPIKVEISTSQCQLLGL